MTKNKTISIPSKTFILGEYVALQGGPSLLLTTTPCFELTATDSATPSSIHPESPAGKLSLFSATPLPNFQWHDPYKGLGGFGASTAQFIGIYTFQHDKIDPWQLLEAYQKHAWNGQGLPPSGADLIAQLMGGVCFFHKKARQIESYDWPFSDLAFCLIHTGKKIATHIHLRGLIKRDTSQLEEVAFFGSTAFREANSEQFIEAIQRYAEALDEQALVTSTTQELLKLIRGNPAVLASKGCGALGSDVILLLYRPEKQKALLSWLKHQGLNVVAYGTKAAPRRVD